MAVLYGSTSGNHLDLLNFTELYKNPNFEKHEGLFQVSLRHPSIRARFDLSVVATREKVKAEIEEMKPVLVIGSPMCSAKDLKVERAAALAHWKFA